MSNIYDESYELNGPLPFYHPKHLIHYLMWGKLISLFAQERSLKLSNRKDKTGESGGVNFISVFEEYSG